MRAPPHIVIVGAGLIGLSTADALQRRGARVTVLEARAAPMHGASHANSGMIHPSQACSWGCSANDPAVDAAVFDLACQSWARMEERMRVLGLEAMRARPPGCHQLFDDPEAARAARARLSDRGIRVELSAAGTSRFGRTTLFFPDDRSGDAFIYGLALAESIALEGGRIITNAEDVNLARYGNGRAVVTIAGQTLPCDHIVIASGSGSAELLDHVDVDLPLQAVRGWAADYDISEGITLPDAPVMDARTRSALTVFGDRFRLSGTWGETRIDPLLNRWSEIMPQVMAAAAAPVRTWSGLRPVSSLGRPYIGPVTGQGRFSNLWVNGGHGHMGWTLCGGSGDLLARMILDGATDARFAVPS